jgi:hypothetical protein
LFEVKGKRVQEILSVWFGSGLFLSNGLLLLSQLHLAILPGVLLAAFSGILLADFLSG